MRGLSAGSVALVGNALLFQVAWFINVMDLGLLPVLITALAVSVHLVVVHRMFGRGASLRECGWLLFVTVLGFFVERVFLGFDVLQHESQTRALFGIPYWLLFLWLVFATTFRFSLAFLRERIAWSVVLGACAALSYLGGAALNTTSQLASPTWIALLWIALVWALVLPVLVVIHKKYVT